MLTNTDHAPYCLLPRQLLADLRDSPLAIGVYLLVARLFLVARAPVPLARADVLRYDPSLKAGAVARAFDRLIGSGYLLTVGPARPKRQYLPSWGRMRGASVPWQVGQPGLGRPRHLAALRVGRDLLDVGLGRLSPHLRHPAEIARYLESPALGLADVGGYALFQGGIGALPPALTCLGLLGKLPPALMLLRQLAEQSGLALSEAGQRRLGLRAGENVSIGSVIGPLIGGLIGSATSPPDPPSAAGSAPRPIAPMRPRIPATLSDLSESATPPPAPRAGGGAQHHRRAARRTPPAVPETEATVRLAAIQVRPAQQRELADTPLAAVERAIADGQARPGIRDLAGWVVYLLRQRRDSGWAPAPPTPRPDPPEALGAYFKQLASKQEHGEGEAAMVPMPAQPLMQLPCSDLWQDMLAQLRLRLPRQVYLAILRQAELVGHSGGVVTIAVADARLRELLEHQCASALRLALEDVMGQPVQVRLIQSVYQSY